MITLDPTLQAVLDGIDRKPLVNLMSVPYVPAIPFEGVLFNGLTETETSPDAITLTDGRVAVVIYRDSDLILIITDVDQTSWVEYNIYNPGGVSVLVPSIVEVTAGNIGVFLVDNPGDYRLRIMTVSPEGVIISAPQTITTSEYEYRGPSVTNVSGGSFAYMMTYVYKNSLNEYELYYKVSSDFVTWESEVAIPLTGLSIMNRVSNTSVLQLASGEIFVVFDYLDDTSGSEELINVYVVQSLDYGATWTDPVKITNYEDYGTYGKHPTIAERQDGSIVIAYQEEKDVLKMNSSTPGWDATVSTSTSIYFNPLTEKLYVKQQFTGVGTKNLRGITIIDVPTWTIDKVITYSSDPSLHLIFNDNSSNYEHQPIDSGPYSVVWILTSSEKGGYISVYNVDSDTMTLYACTDIRNDAYEIDPCGMFTGLLDWGDPAHLEVIGDWLYITWTRWVPGWNHCYLSKFDLTELPDPVDGTYSSDVYWGYSYINSGMQVTYNNTHINPDAGMFLYSWIDGNSHKGGISLMELESGGLIEHYEMDTHPGFPKKGMVDPVIIDNHIYGGILYEPLYGQAGMYGLCDLDIATGSFRYHRPSWATLDNYQLSKCQDLGDGRIMFESLSYGISIFDIPTETWVYYDANSTLPGMGGNYWFAIDHDPVEKLIFAAGPDGIIAFPEVGTFQQLQYIVAEDDNGWTYDSPLILANEYTNSDPAITIDNDDILWAFWTHRDVSEYSAHWAQEVGQKDLTPYLTEDALSVTWEIKTASVLEFTLSHGHLFDPTNTMSILAQFTKKGRRIEIQLGELISEVEYFAPQGFYIVDECSTDYSRGRYPTIAITCVSPISIWMDMTIAVTDYFSSQYPEVILGLLLEEYGTVAAVDIDFPNLVNSYALHHQYVDEVFGDIVNELLDHFNYFFYITMDGKYSARRFNLLADVSASYTGVSITKFTPDNTYSSFINQEVVRGEGLDPMEVIYETELLQTLDGTIGWWGGDKIIKIWYSEDHETRARNPFLEIITSIQEFEVFTIQGGGKEWLSDIDIDEYWVEITIEAPDLMAIFIALCLNILGLGIVAMWCGTYTGPCGPYLFAMSILMQMVSFILGAVAQYSYEVWAEPIGDTKISFQATADDLIFQRQLNGMVVSNEEDDPYCYTQAQCQIVADNALAVDIAQRNGATFTKIAHLQDEIGDIIQVQHPYTGLNLKTFVSKIQRTYKKGSDGGLFDNVTGWLL